MTSILEDPQRGVRGKAGGGLQSWRAYQVIAPATQPQTRHRELRQLRTQIAGLQQTKAFVQCMCCGLAAFEQHRAEEAQFIAGLRRTLRLQHQEAIQGSMIVAHQFLTETLEHLRIHAGRPIACLHETRAGGDHSKTAHTGRMARGECHREQATQRPADHEGRPIIPMLGVGRGGIEHFDEIIGHCVERQRHAATAAATMPRQIDTKYPEARGKSLGESGKNATVHGPAMHEQEHRAAPGAVDV